MQNLRMSHKEIRDEMKDTDGNPKLRQAPTNAAIYGIEANVRNKVPIATVVVTNPNALCCCIIL